MTTAVSLTAKDIHLSFGKSAVLRGVDLDVAASDMRDAVGRVVRREPARERGSMTGACRRDGR